MGIAPLPQLGSRTDILSYPKVTLGGARSPVQKEVWSWPTEGDGAPAASWREIAVCVPCTVVVSHGLHKVKCVKM